MPPPRFSSFSQYAKSNRAFPHTHTHACFCSACFPVYAVCVFSLFFSLFSLFFLFHWTNPFKQKKTVLSYICFRWVRTLHLAGWAANQKQMQRALQVSPASFIFFRPTSLHFSRCCRCLCFALPSTRPTSITKVERTFHAATRSHPSADFAGLWYFSLPRGGASQRNRRMQRLPAARSTDERVVKATQTARRRGAVFRVPSRSPPEGSGTGLSFWPALSRNCEGASARISKIVCRCTSLETGRLGIVSEELRDGSGMQRHRDAAATVAAV